MLDSIPRHRSMRKHRPQQGIVAASQRHDGAPALARQRWRGFRHGRNAVARKSLRTRTNIRIGRRRRPAVV